MFTNSSMLYNHDFNEEPTPGYIKASEVIAFCNLHVDSLKSEDDKNFVNYLSGYLATRKSENNLFSFNDTEREGRAIYIKKLVTAVINESASEQTTLLADKHINLFKGTFSHRLYDVLLNRRNEMNGCANDSDDNKIQLKKLG